MVTDNKGTEDVKLKTSAVLTISMMCALSSQTAIASSFSFSANNGVQSAAATFTFDQSQGTLSIQLTNTMTANAGPNWLTGLYFDLGGSPALGAASAAGDLCRFHGTDQIHYEAHTTGQLWAMRDDLNGALPFGGMQYGLSCVGAGVFSAADMIEPGGPHPQPNGVDGGIVGDFSGVTVPMGHQKGGLPFVIGAATFQFLLPQGFDFDSANVSNVAFHFGSGYDEVVMLVPEIIPLPAPVFMTMIGLAGVMVLRRRSAG